MRVANRTPIVHSETSHEPRRPCTPETFQCREARIYTLPTPQCCRAHLRRVLAAVATLLDSLEVPWYIQYGTLLGWCTNGGVYWNDKDVDVAVLDSDRPRILEAAPRFFSARGMYSRYDPPNSVRFEHSNILKVRLSKSNRNSGDITFWQPRNGLMDRDNWAKSDRYKGREFPVEWAFPTQRSLWEGIEVNVPAEPFRLVEWIYGSNWDSLPAVRFVRRERGDYAAA